LYVQIIEQNKALSHEDTSTEEAQEVKSETVQENAPHQGAVLR
jgi:hypothetical protein